MNPPNTPNSQIDNQELYTLLCETVFAQIEKDKASRLHIDKLTNRMLEEFATNTKTSHQLYLDIREYQFELIIKLALAKCTDIISEQLFDDIQKTVDLQNVFAKEVKDIDISLMIKHGEEDI